MLQLTASDCYASITAEGVEGQWKSFARVAAVFQAERTNRTLSTPQLPPGTLQTQQNRSTVAKSSRAGVRSSPLWVRYAANLPGTLGSYSSCSLGARKDGTFRPKESSGYMNLAID